MILELSVPGNFSGLQLSHKRLKQTLIYWAACTIVLVSEPILFSESGVNHPFGGVCLRVVVESF
jgi:hypothetical protein